MKRIDEKQFIKICQESKSMAEACSKLNCMHFNTFKRKAIQLGCYKPNQSHKGMKLKARSKISTQDILEGKYPSYVTFLLKKRLFKEGIKEDRCELCG